MSPKGPAAPPPAAFRGSGPFLEIAPRLSLPMRHFAFAAAALWVFSASFVLGCQRLLGFDFSASWALGLVHILTLGWVSMTILGAQVQMVPVHGEVPLRSPWAVAAGWWLFAAGILGFVGHLWSGSQRYWVPASLLLSGFILYLYALGRTAAAAKKIDWTGWHLVNALGYLAALAALGVLLAYDRQRAVIFRDPQGALIAHVHLALIGWVSISIFGASYRLVSPFALSRLESKIPGSLALLLTNAGLAGLALDSLFFGRRMLPLWACLLAAGYLCFAWQIGPAFKNQGSEMSPSIAFVLLALMGGAVWAGLGLCLAFGWIQDTAEARAGYVFSALVGWVTPTIFGQIHKIVPFLVWLHVYSPRQWTPPIRVPKIEDISSQGLAWAEFASWAPALPLGLAGFMRQSPALLRASGLFMLAAATLYGINTAMTLSHLLLRDPRWSAPRAGPS